MARMVRLVIASTCIWAWPNTVGAQVEPMRTVVTERGAIAFHVVGDGPGTPLVFINGGPGFDHRFYHLAPVWERLGARGPVVFFDQPGTGESYPVDSNDTVTIEHVLTGIDAVRSELDADRIVLLGHSWGGYLAMAYALRHPDATAAVVLVGTAAPNFSDTEFNFAPLFPDSLARGATPSSDPDAARKDLRRHLAMSFYSPSIRELVTLDFGGLPYNARQASLLEADARANDLWPRLGGLRSPVLVGTGRFDANVAPRTSWRVHQAIPASQFVVWERSGHYPMIEEPDDFVGVISRFLDEAGRR